MDTQIQKLIREAGVASTGIDEAETASKLHPGAVQIAASCIIYLAYCNGITGRFFSAVHDDWKTIHFRKHEIAQNDDAYRLRRKI